MELGYRPCYSRLHFCPAQKYCHLLILSFDRCHTALRGSEKAEDKTRSLRCLNRLMECASPPLLGNVTEGIKTGCCLVTKFPRPEEYCSGLPFPSPGNLPNPWTEPRPPALAGGVFTTESPEKHKNR